MRPWALVAAVVLTACDVILPLSSPVTQPDAGAAVSDAAVSDAVADSDGTCDPMKRPEVLDPCREVVCQNGAWTPVWRDEGQSCTADDESGAPGICYGISAGKMTCCTGCWEAGTTTCRMVSNDEHCGTGGMPCQVCGSAQCGSSACVGGVCTPNSNEDMPCTDVGGPGTCHGGSCCTGCWDGTVCRKGDTAGYCGTGGGPCAPCTATPCQQAFCGAGVCKIVPSIDGAFCTDVGGPGTCHGGSCCTGCWDGTVCRKGDTVAYCGAGGALCDPCLTGPCQVASCLVNKCLIAMATDGASCFNLAFGAPGHCYNGDCCTGCWDKSTGFCQLGNSDTHCGTAGDECQLCATTSNECVTVGCTAGTCNPPVPDSTWCSGGACYSGSCCTGCWDSSSCQPGTADIACGDNGNPCQNCPAMSKCGPNSYAEYDCN